MRREGVQVYKAVDGELTFVKYDSYIFDLKFQLGTLELWTPEKYDPVLEK